MRMKLGSAGFSLNKALWAIIPNLPQWVSILPLRRRMCFLSLLLGTPDPNINTTILNLFRTAIQYDRGLNCSPMECMYPEQVTLGWWGGHEYVRTMSLKKITPDTSSMILIVSSRVLSWADRAKPTELSSIRPEGSWKDLVDISDTFDGY